MAFNEIPMKGGKLSLRPAHYLLLGFAGAILMGAILLWLPVSTNGAPISFVDALFTSTSAVCVTGLIVVDTGTKFTLFGQLVILTLIQMGGLGIMTFSVFFMILLGKRISFKGRVAIHDSFSHSPFKDFSGMLRAIFVIAFGIEALGAIGLTLCFARDFPLRQAIYSAVFHSISAFCNAGFSLFPDSLVRYQNSIPVNVIFMLLIVFGGLGFLVLIDLPALFDKHRKVSLHTKIVLITTGGLIFFGAVFIFVTEYADQLAALPMRGKILASFFQSITPRTAGFNTISYARLTNATLFFTLFLMFVGASPGSCGGGIKTSTFSILLILVWRRIHGHRRVSVLQRTLPQEVTDRVIVITFLAFVTVFFATMILLVSEGWGVPTGRERLHLINILFEVVSAFGTVGLSTGITASLSAFAKVVLVAVMYVGRVGPATVAFSMRPQEEEHFQYAEEHAMVG
ncbi:MAG: hypothetical protein DSY91_07475 [Deltaproteobacteria bacterium]|nr:MAG: hypothetical protein DSY91_07475 [Deltaproteobacteria bacterium]